jgi:predicted nucleotidyltransferase
MNKIIEDNKTAIIELCKQHFIKSLYAFGSVVQNTFTNRSDIDFLYEVDIENFKGWATGKYDYTDNLLSFEKALHHLLERKIDLVPNISIRNKYLKQSIENTKYKIYAA